MKIVLTCLLEENAKKYIDFFSKKEFYINYFNSKKEFTHFVKKNEDEQVIHLHSSNEKIDNSYDNIIKHIEIGLNKDFLTDASNIYQSLKKLKKSVSKKIGPTINYDLICIGSSTGGVPIVQSIIENIKKTNTILVICQHINKEMSNNLKVQLEKSHGQKITLVTEKTKLQKGNTYLLEGGIDYKIDQYDNQLLLNPVSDPTSIYHPSFDFLCNSISKINLKNMACIVVSGLGNDGSKFLNQLSKKGVTLIAQNPVGSVAPYMPKAAIETGKINNIFDKIQLKKFLSENVS